QLTTSRNPPTKAPAMRRGTRGPRHRVPAKIHDTIRAPTANPNRWLCELVVRSFVDMPVSGFVAARTWSTVSKGRSARLRGVPSSSRALLWHIPQVLAPVNTADTVGHSSRGDPLSTHERILARFAAHSSSDAPR